MSEYEHLKCDLDIMRVANALLTTSALQSVWTDIFAFPTTDCRLTKDGEVLTNCQTVYSLHENRVFPSETDFGWKYAIFGIEILFIPLKTIQIHQYTAEKGSDSTRQYLLKND